MMIMAQHPTQHAHDSGGGSSDSGTGTAFSQFDDIARQNHRHLKDKTNFVAKISKPQIQRTTTTLGISNAIKSTITNNKTILKQQSSEDNKGTSKQQQLQGQDGRRTLIKNQLYLIEQLQLENANLRNERDQLQLENEELKFQLQMISSSNILGQSGDSAFDDRQLEKLVETNDGVTKAQPTSRSGVTTATSNHLGLQTKAVNFRPPDSYTNAPFRSHHYEGPPMINSGYDSQNCGLTKITATPVRQPIRLVNCDDPNCNTDGLTLRNSVKSSAPASDCRRPQSSCCKNDFTLPLTTTQSNTGTKTATASLTLTPTATNKLLSSRSSSLSAFNVKSNLVPYPKSATRDDLLLVNPDEHDDEQSRSIQQLYGGSDKVHGAAIVIQRAFRKYQICKRFRMITEQLRHTCQPSLPVNKQQQRQFNDASCERDHQHHQGARQSSRLTSNNNANSPTNGTDNSVPFVSGATRAAAWESLSQAASRLAASAAAATAHTKQALTNGVSKSASCQQVATIASTRSSQRNPVKTASSTATTPIVTSSNNSQVRSSSQLKSDSVVAAAINFQQLESIRKRQYRVGLNIFNKSPEKGVSFLIAHSFIDCSPPYTKTSTSFYLSNQIHFIDKQHLTGQQQSILTPATTIPGATTMTTNVASDTNQQQQNCRFCIEEENLKRNVAHFLLHRKGLAKEKIGQYLGNLQAQFNQSVLVYYLQELDFYGMQIDVALRKFLSTLRMPGEAQKIERFVDRFAHRYVQCQQQLQPPHVSSDFMSSINTTHLTNDGKVKSCDAINQVAGNANSKNNLTLLTKDEIFILTFAIIMLNTDLHSPSLKSMNRMSANQFINNLRGVFKSQTINENDLIEIYERVKANQITTTPDHVTHVMKVQQGLTTNNFQKKELPNLCVPHRRLVCFCRLFEVYDVNKKERVGQHQREIFLFNDILLVTKLARRARANTPQQYTYRQSIPLQGICVQLFQSAHYNFGIRLCQKETEEVLIMLNARNELDQSKFINDLNESIAEMDEMENIRAYNIVETIHFKQQDRLRRHAMMHDPGPGDGTDKSETTAKVMLIGRKTIAEDNEDDPDTTKSSTNVTITTANCHRRLSSKFNSMSNLASVAEIKDENTIKDQPSMGQQSSDLGPNKSLVQGSSRQNHHSNDQRGQEGGLRKINQLNSSGGVNRSCSTSSVHSLDSGLFLSRDVSPNQSG